MVVISKYIFEQGTPLSLSNLQLYTTIPFINITTIILPFILLRKKENISVLSWRENPLYIGRTLHIKATSIQYNAVDMRICDA